MIRIGARPRGVKLYHTRRAYRHIDTCRSPVRPKLREYRHKAAPTQIICEPDGDCAARGYRQDLGAIGVRGVWGTFDKLKHR